MEGGEYSKGKQMSNRAERQRNHFIIGAVIGGVLVYVFLGQNVVWDEVIVEMEEEVDDVDEVEVVDCDAPTLTVLVEVFVVPVVDGDMIVNALVKSALTRPVVLVMWWPLQQLQLVPLTDKVPTHSSL